MGTKKLVHCIAAMDSKRGIGKNNDLPWRLKKEFSYFTSITKTVMAEGKQNAVIMGKNTYLSIPKKFRPLEGRFNIVLSRTLKDSEVEEGIKVLPNFNAAMKFLNFEPQLKNIESVFVVGGEGVYRETMNSQFCDKIFLTKVEGDFSCDVFFPEFDEAHYQEISLENVPRDKQEEEGIIYSFHVYVKKSE